GTLALQSPQPPSPRNSHRHDQAIPSPSAQNSAVSVKSKRASTYTYVVCFSPHATASLSSCANGQNDLRSRAPMRPCRLLLHHGCFGPPPFRGSAPKTCAPTF